MKAALPHILVIDDDTRLRNLIGKYLIDNGFIVVTAENAEKARDMLKTLEFDLIILDVMMPKETGVEFLARLRKSSQLPVLMLTSQNEVNDRITGLEAGADDYLAKPFDPKELVLRIRSILKRQGGNRVVAPNGLTAAEEGLFNILLQQREEIITRSELAAKLGNISERAVDVQVMRLRKKLADLEGDKLYIQTIRGLGYKLNMN